MQENDLPVLRTSATERLVQINPFYLISTALVIHGTGFWFRDSGGHEPWKLMTLVGAFIILLAMVGIAIVRLGKVWDDARSIFVMLLLLFVELAMSFDDTLVIDPRRGAPLLVVGWLFAVTVFESLFRALKIRFRSLFRLPFHAMLALLFLYPLTMVPAIVNGQQSGLQFQLLTHSLCVAASVLLLLPAVRRGQGYAADNGTPWKSPEFPWVPFAVLVAGLTARTYAMCLSLDPVLSQPLSVSRNLQSIFAGYFLTPIVFAVGVLLLEFGLNAGRRSIQGWSLMLPVVAVWLARCPRHLSALQSEFLNEVTQTFASPLYLSLCVSAVFYGLAVLRRIETAEWWFSAAVLGMAWVGPESMALDSFNEPRFLPLILVTTAQAALGLYRRNTVHLIAAVLCGLPVMHHVIGIISGTQWRHVIEVHFLLLMFFVLGIAWKHSGFLKIASVGLALCCLGGMIQQEKVFGSASSSLPIIYSVVVLALSAVVAGIYRLKQFLPSTIASASCVLLFFARYCWTELRLIKGWQGFVFYAAGLVCLSVAVGISWLKAVRRDSDLKGDRKTSGV